VHGRPVFLILLLLWRYLTRGHILMEILKYYNNVSVQVNKISDQTRSQGLCNHWGNCAKMGAV